MVGKATSGPSNPHFHFGKPGFGPSEVGLTNVVDGISGGRTDLFQKRNLLLERSR